MIIHIDCFASFFNSLVDLNKSLSNNLCIANSNPLDYIKTLVEQYDIQSIYWNEVFESWALARDKVIEQALVAMGVKVHKFNGSLLWEPGSVTKEDGTHYKCYKIL